MPVRPAAEKTRDENLKRSFEDPEYMSVWDRCITRGVPGSMFPAGYNNAYQILQMPGYVIILYEMIHDARIIPLASRSHAPSPIRNWMGDSRAHWEGNTLVVDVTNYNDKGWIASSAAGGRIKGIAAHRPSARRRTIHPDRSRHDAVRSDDRGSRHLHADLEGRVPADARFRTTRIYEYACHEGNQAVANVLKGARFQERSQP